MRKTSLIIGNPEKLPKNLQNAQKAQKFKFANSQKDESIQKGNIIFKNIEKGNSHQN